MLFNSAPMKQAGYIDILQFSFMINKPVIGEEWKVFPYILTRSRPLANTMQLMTNSTSQRN